MKEQLNGAFDGLYTRVLGNGLSLLRKRCEEIKDGLNEALDRLYAKVLGNEPSPLRITIIIITGEEGLDVNRGLKKRFQERSKRTDPGSSGCT